MLVSVQMRHSVEAKCWPVGYIVFIPFHSLNVDGRKDMVMPHWGIH